MVFHGTKIITHTILHPLTTTKLEIVLLMLKTYCFWALIHSFSSLSYFINLFFQKILKSCRSRDSWGPTDPELKREWRNEPSTRTAEEQTKAAADDSGECKLKKEVVAKLNQNEESTKSHVNGEYVEIKNVNSNHESDNSEQKAKY